MAKTFELMEELTPAPSGNKPVEGGPGSRHSELGIVLPAPPTPLAYLEYSDRDATTMGACVVGHDGRV
jgi:hypothetical protein